MGLLFSTEKLPLKIPLKLYNLCLRNVCLNLELQYKICKQNQFKIPRYLSQMLFEMKIFILSSAYKPSTACDFIHNIKDEFKIFEKDITSLSKFVLVKYFFQMPEFLLRIDKNYLTHISLSYDYNFHLNSTVAVKKKAVENLMTDTRNLEYFSCEKGYKFSWISEYLMKSSSSLTKLELDLSTNEFFDWKHVENLLEKCTNLETINLKAGLMNSYNVWNIQEKILNFKETLRELYLCDVKCLYLNKTFFNSLLKFKRLEKLEFFECSFLDENKLNEILRSKIILDLNFIDVQMFANLMDSSFLDVTGKSKQWLKESGIFDDNNANFSLCSPTNDSLKEVSFNGSLHPISSKLVGEFLSRYSNIKRVTLSANRNIDNAFSNVCKGLLKSKKSLKFLSFEFCNLKTTECEVIKELLQQCTNLEEVLLSNNKQIDEGIKHILDGIKPSLKTLKNVDLRNNHLSKETIEYLEEIDKNCGFQFEYSAENSF